jgi:hypothetical protein
MRVQEPDDVAVGFLAFEYPTPVEAHAGSLALLLPLAAAEPDAPASLAEQNPALLDDFR